MSRSRNMAGILRSRILYILPSFIQQTFQLHSSQLFCVPYHSLCHRLTASKSIKIRRIRLPEQEVHSSQCRPTQNHTSSSTTMTLPLSVPASSQSCLVFPRSGIPSSSPRTGRGTSSHCSSAEYVRLLLGFSSPIYRRIGPQLHEY